MIHLLSTANELLATVTAHTQEGGTGLDGGQLNPKAPPGAGGFYLGAQYIKWGVFASGLLMIVIAGGWWGWEKWNGAVTNAPKMVAAAVTGVVVASAALPIVNAFANASGK